MTANEARESTKKALRESIERAHREAARRYPSIQEQIRKACERGCSRYSTTAESRAVASALEAMLARDGFSVSMYNLSGVHLEISW